MRHPAFNIVENKYKRANDLSFDIGDTVVVTLRIVEGDKERQQDFEGEVIARRGQGLDAMFTVRRLVGDEGVERTFPLHSPKIVAIKSKRTAKVRRAKLYYLRDRVGKARRLKEKRMSAEAKAAAAAARADKARKLAEAGEVVAAVGAAT